MNDLIWATSQKVRAKFDDSFAGLANPYIPTYRGDQPILTWHSDKVKPIVHPDFLNHLPESVKERVNKLIQGIN